MTVSQVLHPFALWSVLLSMPSLLLAHSMSWFHPQCCILDGLLQSLFLRLGGYFVRAPVASGGKTHRASGEWTVHARKTELANKGAHRCSDNMAAP
jgi:hypothetical protein